MISATSLTQQLKRLSNRRWHSKVCEAWELGATSPRNNPDVWFPKFTIERTSIRLTSRRLPSPPDTPLSTPFDFPDFPVRK